MDDVLDNDAIAQCSATTLATFSLFKQLGATERAQIAPRVTRKVYRRNEFVICADQPSTRVYFLMSGRVRACAYSGNGKQVQYEDLDPGMTFGELSVLDGSVRSADCIALEKSVVASMSASDFHGVIAKYDDVRKATFVRLVALVRQHMQKVFEFGTTSVAERVRLELVRLAAARKPDADAEIAFDKVPTHADIAARISTHREAVTRELKSLEADGIITWKPGTHTIHSLERLLV